jgi:hypothetical protein
MTSAHLTSSLCLFESATVCKGLRLPACSPKHRGKYFHHESSDLDSSVASQISAMDSTQYAILIQLTLLFLTSFESVLPRFTHQDSFPVCLFMTIPSASGVSR